MNVAFQSAPISAHGAGRKIAVDGASPDGHGLERHTFSFDSMGTACSLHLYAPGQSEARDIAESAISEVERIEARYSRYRSESDLSQINRVAQAGGSIEVDGETAGLLNYAFAAWQRSGGLFDISSGILRKAWDFRSGRLPEQHTLDELLPRVGLGKLRWEWPRLTFTVAGMELDFGGIGKEYAADRAAAVCMANGSRHGLVDLGGDIRVIGPHPDGTPWRIGIRHPQRTDSLMATADVSHGALATSGDYERCIMIGGRRYGHILHPRTGRSVRGLSSVTVVADHCLLAGMLCTISMLKGGRGANWLRRLGVLHLWMNEEGRRGGSQLGVGAVQRDFP